MMTDNENGKSAKRAPHPWARNAKARGEKGNKPDHPSAKPAKVAPRGNNSVRASVVTGKKSSFVRMTVFADFRARDE